MPHRTLSRENGQYGAAGCAAYSVLISVAVPAGSQETGSVERQWETASSPLTGVMIVLGAGPGLAGERR